MYTCIHWFEGLIFFLHIPQLNSMVAIQLFPHNIQHIEKMMKYNCTQFGHVEYDSPTFHTLALTSNTLPTPHINLTHLFLPVQDIVHCILFLKLGGEVHVMTVGPFYGFLKSHMDKYIWTKAREQCVHATRASKSIPHLANNYLPPYIQEFKCWVHCDALGLHQQLTTLERCEHGLPPNTYPTWGVFLFQSSVIALGFQNSCPLPKMM